MTAGIVSLGALLAAERARAGMTQRQAAEGLVQVLGGGDWTVFQTSISRWEGDLARPEPRKLSALLDVYEAPRARRVAVACAALIPPAALDAAVEQLGRSPIAQGLRDLADGLARGKGPK